MLGVPALALTSAAAPAHAAAACPTGQACLVVHVVGTVEETRVVTPAELGAWVDLPAQEYDLQPGTAADVPAAVSVGSLVAHISDDIGGVGVENVTYVGIPRPGRGDVATLDQEHDHNLGPAGQNGFVDGKQPAVYVVGRDTSVGYIRPLRGAGDDNHLDYFQSDSATATTSTSLDMTLHTSGQVLHPVISASSLQVRVGDKVTFTAQVDDAETALSYSWTIGGAGPSTAKRPTVSWSEASSGSGYLVSLSVSGSDTSAGQSNFLYVVVEKKDTPDPTESPDPTETPDPSQDPGGTGPTDNPTTGPVTGDGSDAGGTAGPSQGPEVGSKGTGPAAGQSPEPTAGATGGQAAADASGTVTGLLLTGADVVPVEQGDPVTAPAVRAGSPDDALRLPAWLLLAAILAGVLGLGALSESTRVRARLRGRMRT